MKTRVTVSNQPQVITVSAGTVQKLSLLADVDVENLQDGALLQYNSATGAWVASNNIENNGLTINCGNY